MTMRRKCAILPLGSCHLRKGSALMIAKIKLLGIAGGVWLLAGVNILRLGVVDMTGNWHFPLWPLLGALMVFLLFFCLIFIRLVRKHSGRIMGYEAEKVAFWRFFDRKSYILMIGMITFGILLRSSHWVPPLYLGTFYTGLGCSLMGAGILFFRSLWIQMHLSRQVESES